MSWDFYFWQSSTEADPVQIVDRLADENADEMEPHAAVLAFRHDALLRWPDLATRIEPWHTLEGTIPWGRIDLADRYVVLTLQWSWEHQPELVSLARGHNLRCYDPQISQFV